MKSILIGLIGVLIGIVLGIAIAILGASAFSKSVPPSAVQPSGRPDLSVTASAPFVATQLEQTLRASGLAKNSTVAFAAPNLIRIAAIQDVRVLGFAISINANVMMRVTVQNGRIILKTESVDTGGIPVPQNVMDSTIEPARIQAEDQLNRLVQSGLRGTNLRVVGIRMTENEVAVELSGQ